MGGVDKFYSRQQIVRSKSEGGWLCQPPFFAEQKCALAKRTRVSTNRFRQVGLYQMNGSISEEKPELLRILKK